MPDAIEVRGLSARSTGEFVKARFSDRYAAWLESLPPRSRAIMEDCSDNQWYPLDDALTVPTEIACEQFFGGSPEGAREIGRFSADYVFQGMYKVFIKMGTPLFTLSRACKIFESYLRPIEVNLTSLNESDALIRLAELGAERPLLDLRIMGWIERALELHGCRNIKVSMQLVSEDGERFCEIAVSWKQSPPQR